MGLGNALKAQIAELQARNSELQAFKNSALWAKECPTLLSPASASSIARRGSAPLEQENVGGEERTTTSIGLRMFQPYLETLDDELLGDMVTDWRANPQSAREGQHEAEAMSKQTSDSGSTSCDTGSTLPSSSYLDPGLRPLEKIKGSTASDVMALDPAMGFSAIHPFGTSSSARGRREQGASTPRRRSLASTAAPRPDQRPGALRIAVANRQGPMVRLLVRHGADMNARDERGRTVLHDVAESNDGDMARLLLDNGADAGAVDAAGMAALDVAASLGNVEVAEVLLETCRDERV
ncbi:hypothetical protein CDD82_6283 [Ophiocordyceps australis]|uniref:Uncharacterized protein n=1 Tax=Ophiocordyceps australis TaxID=1399860 RepID=A0A2C5YX28_9HYPO|nr:hypothetical protein CDD82_6283 [Ophiocordyceps australis]